ncbi:AraC family transcriptional regulator [Oceanisphaera sp.]|uniref:AraC family transcriptional regulator n=1 Tax=Oceanisphaera sp. TaxID=1929979 RepID=UPI003A8E6492
MPSLSYPQSSLALSLLNNNERLLFSSREREEVEGKVSSVFKPHSLEIDKRSTRLDSRLHHVPLGQVSFNRLKYGGEVRIQPERLEDFFLIQMPLRGEAHIISDGQPLRSVAGIGSVLNPTQLLDMRWSSACDQLILRIERQALEQTCSSYLGRPIKKHLVFEIGLSWQSNPHWYSMMTYLSQVLDQGPPSPLLYPQLEQLVLGTLLSVQPHSYSQALLNSEQRLAPRHVKRVEEYIQDHADEAITPAMLANLAGVSLRTLYAGFKDFRGVSPMEYLRSIRLKRVREELCLQGPNCSVTDIATRWGFGHMGRFSQEYRRLFGENPSETKRKS